MNYLIALLCLSFVSFANAADLNTIKSTSATQLHYYIISEHDHNTNLFTEGLFIHNGYFYESSGRYANSLLVSYPIVEPQPHISKFSATFSHKKNIAKHYFAEGLTQFNKNLYQLTWRENTVLIYDTGSFNQIKTLHYSGEGWGLTHNGRQLIRSDGSDKLFFHNPDDFTVEKTIAVHLDQKPIANLNELEYSEGFIWANIWQDNRILKIDPSSGQVMGVLDLSAVAHSLGLNDPESVLNGIAYDAEQKALWITGKHWPKLFLLKINE